jgi:hypothetical protein
MKKYVSVDSIDFKITKEDIENDNIITPSKMSFFIDINEDVTEKEVEELIVNKISVTTGYEVINYNYYIS